MKLFLALFLITSTQVFASDTIERVVSDKTHELEIALNSNTVQCSMAGYGASFIKILIPELSAITVLDHRNFGADAPCVSAGMCAPMGDLAPELVIDELNPTEKVEVRVVLKQTLQKDTTNNKCFVSITEEIETNVRGLKFTHQRFSDLGERKLEDCR